MNLGSCGDCFYWAPEPEDFDPSNTAWCMVQGDETTREHYCDFYQDRRERRNPETGEAWPTLEAAPIRK